MKLESLQSITSATELSEDSQGFLAKWSLLFKLPAVTYPR